MTAPEVTREDLKRVEDRVEFVAQEMDGEKLLTRYILEQARRNGDDLAAIKTRVDRIESEMRAMRNDLSGLRSDLGGLRSEFNSSQDKLPGVIATVMREVLRETKN
jgi:chromosome segregation ATPase